MKIIKTADKSTRENKNFRIEIDKERVQKAYDEAGFFMMLSNRELPPVQMIGIGRQRDSAEKAFRRFKTHFDLSRTYSHKNDTYTGKMFVAFLSLVMLSAFAWYVRPILRGTSSATTSTLIAELRRYKMLKKPDGSWMPAYALNRQQKEVLEYLNVAPETLEEKVRAVRL